MFTFICVGIFWNRNEDRFYSNLWDIASSLDFLQQFCRNSYVLLIYQFRCFYVHFFWAPWFPILLIFSALITSDVKVSGASSRLFYSWFVSAYILFCTYMRLFLHVFIRSSFFAGVMVFVSTCTIMLLSISQSCSIYFPKLRGFIFYTFGLIFILFTPKYLDVCEYRQLQHVSSFNLHIRASDNGILVRVNDISKFRKTNNVYLVYDIIWMILAILKKLLNEESWRWGLFSHFVIIKLSSC